MQQLLSFLAGLLAAAAVHAAPRDELVLPVGASVDRDIAYGTEPAQRLDVYMPGLVSNAPMLLLVHGEPALGGDKASPAVVASKLAHWLGRGYVIASAGYRSGKDETVEDLAKAFAFLQTRAPLWGGDGGRVVVVAFGNAVPAAWPLLLSADAKMKPAFAGVMVDGPVPPPEAALQPGQRPLLMLCTAKRCPAAQALAEKAVGLSLQAQLAKPELTHRELATTLGVRGPHTAAVDSFLRTLRLP